MMPLTTELDPPAFVDVPIPCGARLARQAQAGHDGGFRPMPDRGREGDTVSDLCSVEVDTGGGASRPAGAAAPMGACP